MSHENNPMNEAGGYQYYTAHYGTPREKAALKNIAPLELRTPNRKLEQAYEELGDYLVQNSSHFMELPVNPKKADFKLSARESYEECYQIKLQIGQLNHRHNLRFIEIAKKYRLKMWMRKHSLQYFKVYFDYKVRTSKDWLKAVTDKDIKHGFSPFFRILDTMEVVDYDGWNRKNFDFSFNQEKITLEEFRERLEASTLTSK